MECGAGWWQISGERLKGGVVGGVGRGGLQCVNSFTYAKIVLEKCGNKCVVSGQLSLSSIQY